MGSRLVFLLFASAIVGIQGIPSPVSEGEKPNRLDASRVLYPVEWNPPKHTSEVIFESKHGHNQGTGGFVQQTQQFPEQSGSVQIIEGVQGQESQGYSEECDVQIDLSNTGIQRINREFIYGQNIEELILSGNEIHEIREGAFIGLPHLKFLDLSRNNLTLSDFFRFGEHLNLEEIIYDDNTWSGFPGSDELEVYGILPKLRKLSLRNTHFSSISSKWQTAFPLLNFLDVSYNKLHLKSFFKYLPINLKTLYLINAGFDSLCFDASNKFDWLKGLTSLYMDDNNIQRITAKETCLPNSFELNFYYPYENKLQKLSLQNCNIQKIDENAFDFLTVLEELNLSNNNIAGIYDNTLSGLRNLREFDLSYNPLKRFPNFAYLKHLEFLKLEELKDKTIFKNFNAKYFKLDYLDTLSLAGNHLETITETIFQFLPSLKTLDLSRNYIKYVDINWPVGYSLQEINLSENLIDSFEKLNFKGLTTLKKLDINYNTIHTFSSKSFKYLPEDLFINYSPICPTRR